MGTPSADGMILRSMQLVQHHAEQRTVSPGEVIFNAGDHGDCLYAVLEGQVRLAWGDGSRAEQLGPGHCFGEGALVQPDHTRHGTAIALEPTQLLVMNRERFLFALQTLPMFALELVASLEARLQAVRQSLQR